MGHDAVSNVNVLPTFRWILPPPSSGLPCPESRSEHLRDDNKLPIYMVSHLQDSNIQQQRCETPNHTCHETTRVNTVGRRLVKRVYNKSFTITLVCVCVCV